MDIIFLGLPGSGKGTQSSILHEKCDIPLIAMGNILRKLSCANNDIGNAMKSGDLISDDIVNNIIQDQLSNKCHRGFIMDGYPRNKAQVKFLDDIMIARTNKKIVFYMKVNNVEELANRMKNRMVCSGKQCDYICNKNNISYDSICPKCKSNMINRPDDEMEIIKCRILNFQSDVEEMIEHYQDFVVTIDSHDSISSIAQYIYSALSF